MFTEETEVLEPWNVKICEAVFIYFCIFRENCDNTEAAQRMAFSCVAFISSFASFTFSSASFTSFFASFTFSHLFLWLLASPPTPYPLVLMQLLAGPQQVSADVSPKSRHQPVTNAHSGASFCGTTTKNEDKPGNENIRDED